MDFRQFIIKIGARLGRSEGEQPQGSPRALLWKKRLGITACLILLLSFVTVFFLQGQEWKSAKLEVPVPWPSWHTLYSDPAQIDPVLQRPSTDVILASPFLKGEREMVNRTQARGKAAYWVAAEIPVTLLKSAAEKHAQVLSLGFSSSHYRLWLDDSLITEGSEKISQLVFIPISAERLLTNKPLRVVFENKNLGGWTYPDMLEIFLKGPGFMTAEGAALHSKEMDFFTNTKPSVLCTLYLVLAVGFLFFWMSSPKRQEYFVMFLYALLLSVLQGRLIKFGHNFMTPLMGYRFDVVTFCLESGLFLTITLAFARLKRSILRIVLASFVLIPLGLLCVYTQRNDILAISSQFQKYLAPPMIMIGAFVCFVQAFYLHWGLKISKHIKQRRITRLILFGVGLLTIAYVHLLEVDMSAFEGFHFWSLAHIGMVIFLAAFVVSDYHETEALIGRVPFSSFHRPENLNLPVSGAVMSLDLKNSEILMKEGARFGDSSALVHETTMLMRHTLTALGGTLILTDGDAIKCFFPERPAGGVGSAESALSALNQVQTEIKTLTRTLKSQNRLPVDYEISFRAGIAVGSIRPIINSFNGKDHPEWEQVGQGQPFLESARLMEAENSLEKSADSCIVLLQSPSFLPEGWTETSAKAKFKHGMEGQVVCLKPLYALRAVA